jgi:hypothetical protein
MAAPVSAWHDDLRQHVCSFGNRMDWRNSGNAVFEDELLVGESWEMRTKGILFQESSEDRARDMKLVWRSAYIAADLN